MKAGAAWSWSALRPNPVIGFRRAVGGLGGAAGRAQRADAPRCYGLQLFAMATLAATLRASTPTQPPPSPPTHSHSLPPSTGSFMNLGVSIAVYASLCRELGLPFRRVLGWPLGAAWRVPRAPERIPRLPAPPLGALQGCRTPALQPHPTPATGSRAAGRPGRGWWTSATPTC